MNEYLNRAIYLLLFYCLTLLSSVAQDDMYGDTKSGVKKGSKDTSIVTNKQKRPEKRIGWNDSISDTYALLFFYRSKSPVNNFLPVSIQLNNDAIGSLMPGVEINYKFYTEGKLSVISTLNGVHRQYFFNIKKGNKYFFEIDASTREQLREVTEEFALESFRPNSVIRLGERNVGNSFNKGKANATGFMISQDGYFVTNYHVIDGMNSFTVRGLKGEMHKKYSAKVILSDKNNDLAILKINDTIPLESIPYTLKTSLTETGESIYALGYPIISMLGDEIKVTDGIISSKSGYQGDINAYQISAAVQPGNSGGPIFDVDGNVVGIVNSKVLGAENVNYAIKARVLKNLLEETGNSIVLPVQNTLVGKKLPEQIRLAKDFILIIEVE